MKQKNNLTQSEIRGYGFERKIFGIDSSNTKEKPPAFLERQVATLKVINSQSQMGWNIKEPKTPIGLEMFQCIQSYLPGVLADKLEMFCSLGTTLDYHHGIDGFFRVGDVVASIDLTTGVKPDHFLKADVLVNERELEHSLWRVCREIADRLQS